MITKLPNEEILFTNTSTYTEPVSWLWDFGDDNTSTEENPTHTYADEGVYDVTLNAVDACGSCETSSQQINVTYEIPPGIPEIDWNTILPIAAGALGLILVIKRI